MAAQAVVMPEKVQNAVRRQKGQLDGHGVPCLSSLYPSTLHRDGDVA